MVMPRQRALKPRAAARGQALVETVVLLPLLLLLLLGVEELGRLIYTGLGAHEAAYAGAAYGAQNSATAVDNAGMVRAALAGMPQLSSLTATASHVCTCGDGASAPNCALSDCSSGGRLLVYAQVTTQVPFTPICSVLGWPSTFEVQGSALMPARP